MIDLEDKALEHFRSLREMYAKKAAESDKTINLLVLGDMGTGKTRLLRTAPRPVLLDNWDPGGPKTLRQKPDLVESGDVIVTDFSQDNHKKPTEWKRWEREHEKRKSLGIYNHVGTYCIDSLGPWLTAQMSEIVRMQSAKPSKKRDEFLPAIQDYLIALMCFSDVIHDLASLPCHLIVTGHLATEKDEEMGVIRTHVKIWKSLQVDIPAAFDEVYIACVKGGSAQDLKYELQTRPVNRTHARSRHGNLDLYEPQDLKVILKKIGLPTEDKPKLKL